METFTTLRDIFDRTKADIARESRVASSESPASPDNSLGHEKEEISRKAKEQEV